METSKVRMKIGEHEFEAEGTVESIKEQLEAFRSLVSSSQALPIKEPLPFTPETPIDADDIAHVETVRIMRVQGRVVSLTAIPSSTEDSALLIMLGNYELRNNESVTGSEIGDGLAQSGRPVNRVDRVMDKLIEEALVLKSGFRRATRYRLSNSGHQKALAIARELIAALP